MESFDLISVQTEICNEVFSTLQGFGDLENTAASVEGAREEAPSLSQDLSEEYLQARAVLSSFMSRTGSLDDLNRARGLFESVVAQDAEYAPGWSGLGITHLQYARHGLGGQMHVLEARRAFDRALQLDPGSVEANLYRCLLYTSHQAGVFYGIPSPVAAPAEHGVGPVRAEKDTAGKEHPGDHGPAAGDVDPLLAGVAHHQRA